MTTKILVVRLASADKSVMNFTTAERMLPFVRDGKPGDIPDREYKVPKAPVYRRAIAAGDLVKIREEEADEVPQTQRDLISQLRAAQAENDKMIAEVRRAEVEARRAQEDAEGARREAVALRVQLAEARDEITMLRERPEPEESDDEEEDESEEEGPNLT